MAFTRRAATGWIMMSLGLAGLLGFGVWAMTRPKVAPRAAGLAARDNAASIDENSPLPTIAVGIKSGSGMALALLQRRLNVDPGTTAAPIADAESADWSAIVSALRDGFSRFAPYGRASAVVTSLRILDKYAQAPAPSNWNEALIPVNQLIRAGLSDADATVRVATANELGRFWKWSPGRELETTGELDYVAAWKEDIYRQVIGALADKDASVRARAVGALSTLPIDERAAPAVEGIKDSSFEVRLYVLAGFANRRDLLDEEAILPCLYDTAPAVVNAAEQVLRTRGLTPEQIGLCKLVAHPMAHMRASAIPMLETRNDIDATVWMLYLSRDKDESVRVKAVDALGRAASPEARERLSEMASSDPSAEVREAAAKLAPAVETTASLPPLPGSASLNPRAN